MSHKTKATLVFLVLGGIIVTVWQFSTNTTDRAVVRNAASQPVRDVYLTLRSLDGRELLSSHWAEILPGQTFIERLLYSDSKADLSFNLAGSQHRHQIPYIDLWSGEGWLFEIQNDGSLRTGFDYPGFPLHPTSAPTAAHLQPGHHAPAGGSMPEHAVIVHFDYGKTDLGPLVELEERLIAAIDAAGVGEFDGNEVAVDGSNGTLYMYGPDADQLFEVVRPVLESAACIRNAVATVRYGPPEEGVKEKRMKIGP